MKTYLRRRDSEALGQDTNVIGDARTVPQHLSIAQMLGGIKLLICAFSVDLSE